MDAESFDVARLDADALELLPVGVGYFSFADGRYTALYANGALRALLGGSGETLAAELTAGALRLVHPEEAERVQLMLYKGSVGGGSFRDTVRILDRSERWRWTELLLNAQPQPGGACMLCLVLTDIDMRVEHQRKLDDTYARLLDVMNNTPGGIVAFDMLNDRVPVPIFASRGMERLLRGSRAELESAFRQDPFACIHPDDREAAVRALETAMRRLAPFQLGMRLRTMSGEYIWVSASGMIDKLENQRVVYLSVVDNSAERESQHIQKQILDSFARRQYEHICYIDGRRGAYRVLSSNNDSFRFLPDSGTDFDADMGALIDACAVDEERAALKESLRVRSILASLADREDAEYYCTVQTPAGPRCKRLWLSWIDREALTVSFVSSDITEEYRREEESREALRAALRVAEQANAAKSEFLSRMSHDIRTPLNAIIGFTEMSLEDPTLSAEVREYLTKADSSSKFLLSLINDILNMSRIESGKLVLRESEFALTPFMDGISAIVASQCEARGIRYACEIDAGVRESYMGDRLKLQQVLLNMIGNSVKFTPEGGEIALRVRQERDGDPALLRFEIEDSGCGISPEFLPRLFDPFAQERRGDNAENRGTGLGLAICRSLVDMMGGTIAVDSELGRGSRFTIDVPLCVPKAGGSGPVPAEPAAERAAESHDFGGRRILLAEDNELNAEIARHVLEKAGLRVDAAENGRVACERFAASPEGYYSAILMDIRMPVMDGLEATKSIRSLERGDRSVPIIAMSANAFEEDIRQATASGMNAYTIKPIDSVQLFETLHRFLK